MDEDLRGRLSALASRRRSLPPTRGITAEGWPREMLEASRLVWARRVFNEAGSLQIAQRLRSVARAAGVADPPVVAVLDRLEEDERLHQELATDVLLELGGSPRLPEPAPAPADGPAVELARLVLINLSVCETVSAARYAAVLEHTDRPGYRDRIEIFLRDEVVHSEMGFLLLPMALELLAAGLAPEEVTDFIYRELKSCFRELDSTIGLDASRSGGLPPARPQPTDNPGVVEPAVDARAFYDAVQETILPRLAKLSIPGRKAWDERWAT